MNHHRRSTARLARPAVCFLAYWGLLATICWPALPLHAAESDSELIQRGFETANRYCGRCHGEGNSQGPATLVISRPDLLREEGYVVIGSPGDSPLWQRIEVREMPPENQPQPSEQDRAALKAWIAAGSPAFLRDTGAFVGDLQVLETIRGDLRKLSAADRPHARYFTLAHLHNNGKIDAAALRNYRAALAKTINSMSWKPQLHTPRQLGPGDAVLAIDLRRLGWDAADWDAILQRYPYGLRFDQANDDAVAAAAAEVRSLCGSPLPLVRIDWFVTNATRPPLYHRLLELPATDRELEAMLQIDVDANFLSDVARRAGFAESGVSVSNRLVERHPQPFGYYWKSYDFRRSNGTGSLFQFPLGPAFAGHPHGEFAFRHDGGEIIFSLPNGLQGYYLSDGGGGRLDAGPIDVVRDVKETSGTPLVVNGISCMHCHEKGLIDFRDSVRAGLAVYGDVRAKTLRLYPPAEEMDAVVRGDNDRFLHALAATLTPWLGEQVAGQKSDQVGEPVATTALFYYADVTLEKAAYELGLEDAEVLGAAIRHNPTLRKLGLGPLIHGQMIDRQVWENQEAVVSPMQVAARELEIATPYVVLTVD